MNIMMINQFCLGVPLSYFLGVKLEFGIPGLFVGIAVGNIVVVSLFVKLILAINWERIIQEVHDRMEDQANTYSSLSDSLFSA